MNNKISIKYYLTLIIIIITINCSAQNLKDYSYQFYIKPLGNIGYLYLNEKGIEFHNYSSRLNIDSLYFFNINELDSVLYYKIQSYVDIYHADLDKEIDSNMVMTVNNGYGVTIYQNGILIKEPFEIYKSTQKNGLILLKMIFDIIPEIDQNCFRFDILFQHSGLQ